MRRLLGIPVGLALALSVGVLWWWAVLRLVLAPAEAGPVEGAVAVGGWGLGLLPVHCVPGPVGGRRRRGAAGGLGGGAGDGGGAAGNGGERAGAGSVAVGEPGVMPSGSGEPGGGSSGAW
ncbi:hypothetical protein OG898_02950 [Streptomyces sp. NBC_00193]|uniref:hypothetical protein n=1 Tax=Streptomyces sp. NBC_00193 TaxID=2975675 RepID=UPI002252A3F2|nr:hypothetical protein [Streptomyces sp. NBC_00193]MCX5295455.1 hypothetical protein [Streptomyces sp. NBC_00193]